MKKTKTIFIGALIVALSIFTMMACGGRKSSHSNEDGNQDGSSPVVDWGGPGDVAEDPPPDNGGGNGNGNGNNGGPGDVAEDPPPDNGGGNGNGNGDGNGNGNGNGDGNGNNDNGGGDEPFADYDNDGIPDDQDPDADGDGFYGEEDDCDDLDDNIYPGAPDKPDYPDYTDSNCDGIDGDLADAYWVAPDGKDTDPGTIDQPFLTIQKGINAAQLDPTHIKDVYIVEGTYNEDAVLVEGVGLYGGYGLPDNETGLRERDIDVHHTEYDCLTNPFIATFSTNGQESVIEGMTFVGLPDIPAFIVWNALPTIRHNKIYGVDGFTLSASTFILAAGDLKVSRPFFYDNLIESADCTKPGCTSLALLIGAGGKDAVVGPILKWNDIRSGVADFASYGVVLGSGQLAYASMTAVKNDIEAGEAGFITSGIIMGYNVFEEELGHEKFTDANIYQNQIYGGSEAQLTFGVKMAHATGLVKLTNNFITGGHNAGFETTGIFVEESTADITNNTINAGSALKHAESIALDTNAATKIDNNILFAENALNRFGVVENAPVSTPESLRNNLFDEVLDIKYHDFGVGDILNIAVVNAMPDIAVVGDNITGDSAFEDVAVCHYHLLPESDAIDAGLNLADVYVDIDNDPRPEGEFFDIGADEFVFEGL